MRTLNLLYQHFSEAESKMAHVAVMGLSDSTYANTHKMFQMGFYERH